MEALSIPIHIKTLTPVSVGDDKGEQLTPHAEYVFSNQGDMLFYLDMKKLERTVMEYEALDDYISGIRNAMNNNRSEFDLEDFIENRLDSKIESFVARKVPQTGIRPGQKVPVTQIVKNGRDPYLPGSSLKGAFRTAMLYQWLLSDEGFPFLQSYADSVAQYRDLRETWFKMKKNRGQVDYRELKNVESEVKKHNRAIFNEDDLYGGLRQGPEARFLRVRDTTILSDSNSLEVQALRRIRLVAGLGKSTIPQIVEAIPAGQTMDSEVSILPGFTKKTLKSFNKSGFDHFFGGVRAFSLACIENEIQDLLDAIKAPEKPDHLSELEKLLTFYQELKTRAEGGAVLLRLGFGKTVNDNSLMLAFLNGMNRKTAWHDMRAAYHKVFRESALYPVTRLVTPGGAPMGWVEIMEGD